MADMFKSRVSVKLPRRLSVWDAVQHLTAYAHDVMKELPGTTGQTDFRLADHNGSDILRPSLADLEAVVRQLRLKPRYVIGTVTVTPPGEQPWVKSLEVQVWGYFKGSSIGRRVFIYTEAADKIQVDGVRTQLEREAKHLRSIKPRNSDPVHEDTRSWIARTWRDHTAVFLLTVGGGLVVVVLGLWLRLTP